MTSVRRRASAALVVVLFVLASGLSPASADATFTVTTTEDTNGTCEAEHCSLREAITAANAAAGTDVINFALPGPDYAIVLGSPLPSVTEAVSIDGTSQTGYADTPIVSLDGSGAGAGDGLVLAGSGITVAGLAIVNVLGTGVRINGSGNTVEASTIGTDGAGTTGLGNSGNGVFVVGSNNVVGGAAADAGNVIAGNGTTGVRIANLVTGNLIRGNRIESNGGAGVLVIGGSGHTVRANAISGNGALGIDLYPVGVTANDSADPDSGANGLQNFPLIASAVHDEDTATTLVTGSLNSTASTTFTVELFANAACDASGNGEAEEPLGTQQVTTGASGVGPFTATIPDPGLPVGAIVTATATNPSGSTSELSGCETVEEEAPPADRPNIVVILTDDQSYDSIPHTPAPMPYLQGRVLNPADHWARFSRAYLNTPLCCPSRASLLTGRYSHHHGVDDNSEGNKLDESSTLATWLDDAGYRTGLVGKYFNNYPWNRGNYTPPGWDDWAAVVGEVDLYYNYRINDNGTLTTYGTAPKDYSTDVLRDRALDFLDETGSDPFFLYFAPNAPHAPRTPAPRHAGLGTSFPAVRNPSFNEANVSDKPEWIRKLPLLNSNAVAKQDKFRRNAYLSLLAVDEAIAALIGEIEQQGKLDNTIIVFTTDNGYSYGEHRWSGKLCAHLWCSATPLFIRTPGTTSAAIPGLVSNVDIAPTLAELAGVVPSNPVDGHSLVPLMTGAQTQVRQDVLIRWIGNRLVPQYWALRNTNYTYVEYANGEVELYDLSGALGPADPDELVNKCPGLPAVCASAYNSLRNTLHARLAALKA